MLRTLFSRLALLAPALLAWPALAQEPSNRLSFSLGAFGGGHYFDDGTNLGVAAAPDASAGARSNGMLGLRASLGLGRWTAVEAEAYASRTSDRTYDLKATIVGYRLNLLAFFSPGDLRPFILVGGGVVQVYDTHADGPEGLVIDRDGEFHVGLGLDVRFLDHLSLRADVRVVQMPGKPAWSFATDYEGHLGLAVTFGAGPRGRAASKRAETTARSPAPSVAAAPAATTAPPAAAPASALQPPAPVPAPVAPSVTPAPPPLPPAASEVTPAVAATAAAAPPASTAPALKELLGRARELRFEGASSRLSMVSLPFLGQLAEALVRDTSAELRIVSHTAGSGDAKKDMTLSRRRADAVKKALMEREVDGRRLTAIGRGSSEPLAPNITQNGRRLNDRVELRLLSPTAR